MKLVFSAATAGSCRKLMNACASSACCAPAGMTRSSQAMDVPSRGMTKAMSSFSACTWKMSPL